MADAKNRSNEYFRHLATIQNSLGHLLSLYPDDFEISAIDIARRLTKVHRFLITTLGYRFALPPALVMLLELLVASESGEKLSVSKLSATTGMPSTTALRWVVVLEKKRLIERHENSDDRRVALLSLREEGQAVVLKALGAWSDS